MPAHLTLTNRTNTDLKGEVVISVISPYGGMTTDYVVPVELPKETPVELTVSLPGTQLSKDNNKIRFFEGASAKGKEVAIIGKAFLDSNGTADYTFGVLASDPDTLNFMPSLNVRGYQISVMPLTPEQLPDEASLLDYFDVLAINDVATSDWSEQQVAAITGWISKGGTLILSGGAGYSKTAKAFAAIAPVEPDGGTVSQPISPEMVNAGEAKSASAGDMTLSTGKLAAGATKLLGGERRLRPSVSWDWARCCTLPLISHWSRLLLGREVPRYMRIGCKARYFQCSRAIRTAIIRIGAFNRS